MADEGYITADAAARASREPLQVVARAVDNEAPYFVDMVGRAGGADVPRHDGSSRDRWTSTPRWT